jgi:hypothetical protein
MHKAKWDLTLEALSFEQQHANHGPDGEICDRLLSAGVKKPQINIINMIPKVYDTFRKNGAMNIGFTMFETSKIPAEWVKQCNKMDAILVPCNWNKEVFISSGVTVPVEVAIPGVDPAPYPLKSMVPGGKQKYKFYSVFQWSERKNPAALIRAFTSAFDGNPDVSLTIKTYLKNYSKEEGEFLRKEILSIRDSVDTVGAKPQIFLKHEKLTDRQMQDLHISHDCFVLPTRAEGVGLPYIDSMMIGNPTIGTRFSGNLEFMNDSNSFLIDYQPEPVFNMRHLGGWYTGDMRWAQPNVAQLADLMLFVYKNQDTANARAATAREDIYSRMNWDIRLSALKNTLDTLYKSWRESAK